MIHLIKKGNEGWITIKIDLKNAYDRLKWSFIRKTLEDIGLPTNFIKMTWHCISSPITKMLWNGETHEEFRPSSLSGKGIPSHLTFWSFCMERLFHITNLIVDHDFWSPIQLGHGVPKLSLMAFANGTAKCFQAKL